ncbi:MAG: hypothetical protein WKG01_39535 [Kofleriaceae bacterium]
MRRAVVLSLALLAGACKGDAHKCEQAARNYATLIYWDKADAALAKLPEAQRASARKRMLSEFTNGLERHRRAVQQCQSANNDEQVDCMIAAKTAAQIAKCAEPAE